MQPASPLYTPSTPRALRTPSAVDIEEDHSSDKKDSFTEADYRGPEKYFTTLDNFYDFAASNFGGQVSIGSMVMLIEYVY